MKMFRSVLGRRLMLILLAGVLLSFGLLTFLIIRREDALMVSLEKDKAAWISGDTVNHLNCLMTNGRMQVLEQIVKNEEALGNVSVAIFRNDGSVYYGNAAFPMPAGALSRREGTFVETGGQYAFFRPVYSKQACLRCHPVAGVRGVVAAYVSAGKTRAATKNTLNRMLAFIAVTALISGIGVVVAARKIIIQPLESLRDGVRKMSGGDFGHEIQVKGKDEIGELALAFNDMSSKVGNFQKHLTDEICRQTKDLQTIAQVSMEAFRSDQPLDLIIEKALSALTTDLGCDFYCFALLNKETGLFEKKYHRGMDSCPFPNDIAAQKETPVANIVYNLLPQVINAEMGGMPAASGQLAVIPVLPQQRQRCRVINNCEMHKCPAFDSPDEKCWLKECTKCGSYYSDSKYKLPGCVVCPAFPVLGVLVAGKHVVDTPALLSMQILASGIAATIENHKLLEKQKKDMQDLVKLYDLSIQIFYSLDSSELPGAIVRAAVSLSGTDAAALWTNTGGVFDLKAVFRMDSRDLPLSLETDILPEVAAGPQIEKLMELKSIPAAFLPAMDSAGFKYVCLVPVKAEERTAGWLALFKKKHILMSGAEKAIILLYTNQAASALDAVRLYKALQGSVLALSEEKEFSDAVFNSTASGIMVLDNEGKILRLNNSGAEILEIDTDASAGMPLGTVNPALGEMLLNVNSLNREIAIEFEKGRTKPIGFTSSPVLDFNGSKRGHIIVFRDLTELKKLQAEVSKKQHFESMGKVISGVAHEIRNPLFAIQSIGQLLEREIAAPEHQALIGAMLKETTRMKNLVEELLLYSRPSKLNFIGIDLGEFIEELKSRYRLKGMDRLISAETAPGITFRADKDKLTQVFINLIQNSLEASAKKVEIKARKADGRLEISVKDDGAGIGTGHDELVFDPFFTTKKEGTGLGLPICKKIIEEHGGSLVLKKGNPGVEILISLKL